MQCKLRSMNEERAAEQTEPKPRTGFVNQVRREWLVHEDNALAQKLQDEEIEMHYGKNRSERRVVQGDLRQARDMQHEEISEAQKIQDMQAQMLFEQEMSDAQVALELQSLEDKKLGRSRNYEEADQRLALQLQEKEKQRYERKKKSVEKERKIEKIRACSSENVVNIESAEVPKHRTGLNAAHEQFQGQDTNLSPDFYVPPPPPDMDTNEIKLLREEQDAELARLLQEQETKRGGSEDRDRLLAIEAQDRELAKMLQEQERAKLRRAKERAKLKALQKQMDQDQLIAETEGSHSSLQRPNTIPGLVAKQKDKEKETYSSLVKKRHPTEDEIEADKISIEDQPSEQVNIAMAIDPTYNRRLKKNGNLSSTNSRHSNDGNYSSGSTPVLPTPECSRTGSNGIYEDEEHCYDSDEGPAPPYMPIQGQKRQTLDKKKKGKECRQQ